MARLPVLSARDVLRALKRAGFEEVGRKESHIRMKRRSGNDVRVAVVPNHPEIAKGTLVSILRQAGLTREQLASLLD